MHGMSVPLRISMYFTTSAVLLAPGIVDWRMSCVLFCCVVVIVGDF